MGKLGFSIEGDYITDISRQMMQEGNWRGALKILECIDSLPLEDRISILKGDKYVTGTNSLVLLDDDRQQAIDFKEQLKKQFGTIVSYRNKFYSPYASVDSWCDEDVPSPDKTYSSLSHSFTKEFDNNIFEPQDDKSHPYARSLHYADDEQNHVAIGVFNSPEVHRNKEILKNYRNKVILFKECTEPAFFLEDFLAKTPIQTLFQKPWLEPRGAQFTYFDNAEIYSSTDNEPEISLTDLSYPHSDDDFFEEKREQYMNKLKTAICDAADNDKEYGWKTLVDDEQRSLKVPGRAFFHYAIGHCITGQEFKRSEILSALPEYNALSPSGLKTSHDNSFHTDCWIGAGLDINHAYDDKSWQYQLFLKASFDFQKSHLNYDFHLLTRSGLEKFSGVTCNHLNYEDVPKGQRILVIPHLGVEFEQAALNCDAIMCEQGGPMAHLVIVSKECKKKYPIVRVENACIKFCVSLPIEIDLINGKIEDKAQTKKVRP